jgi:hypothetical protein
MRKNRRNLPQFKKTYPDGKNKTFIVTNMASGRKQFKMAAVMRLKDFCSKRLIMVCKCDR